LNETGDLHDMVVQPIEGAAEEQADTAGPPAELVQVGAGLTEPEHARWQPFVAVGYGDNDPVRG
jgi:hypothetical protein